MKDTAGKCLKFKNHLKLVGRSDPLSFYPGKKSHVSRDNKGREKSALFPPFFLRKETRWPRVRLAEMAGARIEIRGTTAFFGEANAFLTGQGTSLLQGTAAVYRTS